MTLVLQVIGKPPSMHLSHELKVFQEEGGNIGRAEHCDLQLPDPDHFISKIHALIHYRDQMYFITDVSSNGTFVNNNTIPIGKGNTKQILEGECFRIGSYRLQASYKNIAEWIQPNFAVPVQLNENDELEELIKNSHSFDELLTPEVSILPKSGDDLFVAKYQNIDELIASLDDDKELLEIELLSENDQEVAELLSPHSSVDSTQINVVRSDQEAQLQKILIAQKVFQRILDMLEQPGFTAQFDPVTLMNLRQQLVAHKESIFRKL